MLLRIVHPVIDIDLRYATADNITGQPIYRADAVACLNPEAHAALMRAADLAEAQNLRLRVFDAYRPAAAQRALWAALPDATFIADPAVGSNHTRGIAVDLTLADSEGQCFDMGTGFDDMTPQSYHHRIDISPEAQRNRLILAGLMTLAGFLYHPHEWWHYDLPVPGRFPLLGGHDLDREVMG